MKERIKSKFLTCASVLIGGLSVFASARTSAASTTQFKMLKGHLIVIPVTVNGAGPHEFLLDTGSNTTLISSEFAHALRLRPIDRVELVTVAGSQIVPRARLESLAVGEKVVKNPETLFSDLREVRALKSEIRGVLGMNFLAQFNFLINYRERRIEFEDEDEKEKSLRGALRSGFISGIAPHSFPARASTHSCSKSSSTHHPADTSRKDARTRGVGGNIRCNRRASP